MFNRFVKLLKFSIYLKKFDIKNRWNASLISMNCFKWVILYCTHRLQMQGQMPWCSFFQNSWQRYHHIVISTLLYDFFAITSRCKYPKKNWKNIFRTRLSKPAFRKSSSTFETDSDWPRPRLTLGQTKIRIFTLPSMPRQERYILILSILYHHL